VALYLIGFVAGLVAGISPCILPVLPVVLVSGATTAGDNEAGPAAGDVTARPSRWRRRRPYAVIAGLILSFSAFTLAGSWALSALGLPQDLLRDLGLAVLGVTAGGLIVPRLGDVLERPFARFGRLRPTRQGGAFVLGLGLGVVFVPCAGPVLAAITVVGATHRLSVASAVLTVDFAAGAAAPLLAVALAGERLAERVRSLRQRAPVVRRVGGAVLLATTLAIAFNLTSGLQRAVPGYTSALQRSVEGGPYAKRQLASLMGQAVNGSLANCQSGATSLEHCGPAPAFAGVTKWLHTPGGAPLTLAALRGRVVLVDFWTYSCINCQRALPHVESWYRTYNAEGLVVVGVHTPEFAFEHVVSNVAGAAAQLGVHYPVAVDDDYKTWNAYANQYWPAEYLIDASGQIRHVDFGEGGYGTTESLIRRLLVAAHPGLNLPAPVGLADSTPQEPLTPESYLGYDRLQNYTGSITENGPSEYHFPASLAPGTLAFDGIWTVGPESATAGDLARLELSFHAKDIYLVLGGTGTLQVSVGGAAPQTIVVQGIPRLYTLVHEPTYVAQTVVIGVSPGVAAYDFTFG